MISPILSPGCNCHPVSFLHWPLWVPEIVAQEFGIGALPEARKRDGVPTVTVFPCPSNLKTGSLKKHPNTFVCELITILGVNGFAWHEVKIKFRMFDPYILVLRALEVHLDPRLDGIPKRAMTEASGVKVSP